MHGFEPFLAEVGAILMGRRTFDVVAAMDGAPWPYGDRPVRVATQLDGGLVQLRYDAPAMQVATDGSSG